MEKERKVVVKGKIKLSFDLIVSDLEQISLKESGKRIAIIANESPDDAKWLLGQLRDKGYNCYIYTSSSRDRLVDYDINLREIELVR